MTQAFSGQMDGTSGTGMGLKPPEPGSFGFWGPPTTKVEATSLNQEPAKWPICWARNPLRSAIVPSGVLSNSPPPYTAPIAVYVAQRTQMAVPGHGPNRAQMGPSGEIARMAHLTRQPMPIDRVHGRSRTRISPQPGCTTNSDWNQLLCPGDPLPIEGT